MRRLALLVCFFITVSAEINAQCSSGISSFPYNEGFEVSDGGWVSGGAGNDWAWGTPSKTVITAAGSGSKCWVVGGLTGSSYTNAEASWLQSPCFDFTGIQYPYIEFKVFWEMEQQFDGASFQYSTDNGSTWINVGSSTEPVNCLNTNWFNYSPITYLSTLTSTKDGWSGNVQTSSGSCRGGNGSGKWVTAKHTMPYLAGKPGVLFRFIFGAGTICNNYDGFAVDDIMIGEAAPNNALFTYNCVNDNAVKFTNGSALCPTNINWDFGDPASGSNNTSTAANPTHSFSGPGKYTVKLTVSGPGNAPSTITHDVTILKATVTMLNVVDCETNTGGSLIVGVEGTTDPVNLSWNTNPVQTTTIISNLSEGIYTVNVSGTGMCPVTGTGKAEKDISCIGVFFPSGFTPNNNGKNDGFGPLGSLSSMSGYKLSVYNRWGERVFYSTDPYEKWNGTVKGFKTDSNVFVWQSEYNLRGQPGKVFRKGRVLLIR